jgi:hypothetical protein
MFNNDLQKAAAKYLDSKTRLNNFSLVISIGSILVILYILPRLIGLFKTTFMLF